MPIRDEALQEGVTYPIWVAMGSAVVGVLLGGAAVYLGLQARVEAPPGVVVSAPAPTCCETSPSAVRGEGEGAPSSLAEAVARTRETVVTLRGSQGLLGAGVIVDPSGLLLTNFHVVAPLLRDARRVGLDRAQASPITVRFANGRELPAALLVGDREQDVALLRLQPADTAEVFPAAQLGRSSALLVGAPVFAIGTPLGLEQTVSSGIVSALDRTHVLANRRLSLIQLDASINFGNSGGPLFNLQGELVGITTAIVERAQGIGFAIPIDHIRALLQAIEEGGSRRSGKIGIEASPETDLSPAAYRLGYLNGIVVERTEPGSPAERAGLRPGDVIVEVRGRRFDALGTGVEARRRFGQNFVDVVRALMPGERLDVTVIRGDEPVALQVEVAAATAADQARIDADELLGLVIGDDDLRVVGIQPRAEIAAWRGAERLVGARITAIIGRPVATHADLGAALAVLRQRVHLGRRGTISIAFALPSGGAIVVEDFPIAPS